MISATVCDYTPPALYDISSYSFENEEKSELRDLVLLLRDHGIASDSNVVRISDITAEVAMAFLDMLPQDSPLPTLSVDEESGIVMKWPKSQGATILILDGYEAMLVTKAGTPEVCFGPDFIFDGEEIPLSIREAIYS